MHILVQEASADQGLAKWIMDDPSGPECEAPAAFAKLWTTATVAEGPTVGMLDRQDPVIDAGTFKGRKVAGRLETAWGYRTQDHAGEAIALATDTKQNDEDASGKPWPDARKKYCAEEVNRTCGGLILDPDQVPSDRIMNRMDSAWREKNTELPQLDNMKNQADHGLIIAAPPKDVDLGVSSGASSLCQRTGPTTFQSIPLGSLAQVLQAITVMANGWLLLGTQKTLSKIKNIADGNPDQVPEWSITDNLSWPTLVRRMVEAAHSLGDSEHALVRYVRVRERQTRQLACNLWREDAWPWGEAMQEAWTNGMGIFWTVTMVSNALGFQVPITGITDGAWDNAANGASSSQNQQGVKRKQADTVLGAGAAQKEDSTKSRIPAELVGKPNANLEKWM